MTALELILCEIPEKLQSLRPAAVPPSGTASQKNCPFLLRIKNGRAQKTKNVKAIFLLGSVLNEQGGGASLPARGQKVSFRLQPPSTFCPLAKMRGWEFIDRERLS